MVPRFPWWFKTADNKVRFGWKPKRPFLMYIYIQDVYLPKSLNSAKRISLISSSRLRLGMTGWSSTSGSCIWCISSNLDQYWLRFTLGPLMTCLDSLNFSICKKNWMVIEPLETAWMIFLIRSFDWYSNTLIKASWFRIQKGI